MPELRILFLNYFTYLYSVNKNLARLLVSIDKLESYIPHAALRNESISKVDIAWQIDHSLNVLLSITKALKQSNPDQYKKRLNFRWLLLGSLSWFPRGKGKAPKVVVPEGEITESSLKKKVLEARKAIAELADFSKSSYFPHPLFGDLNLNQALKFMCIHTQHHLKICRDILLTS